MAITITPGSGSPGEELNSNYNQSITASASVTYPNENEATVTITLTSNFVKNYWCQSHGVVFETKCDGKTKGPTSLMGNSRGGTVYAASYFSSNKKYIIEPFEKSHTYTVSRGSSDKEISWEATAWGSYDDEKGSSSDTIKGKLTITSGHTHKKPSGGSAKSKNVTQTSMTITWTGSDFNWGCTSSYYSKWWIKYKKSTDANYPANWTEVASTDDKTLTGLTPNTNYNIQISVANSHYDKDDSLFYNPPAITVRTLCATPNVSIANANKYNNQNGVSASTTSIKVLASNSASNTGNITYTYRIKKSGGSYGAYQTPATFSDLTPGTTYVVEALGTNPDNGTDTAEITIRTKYATPVATIANNNKYNGQNGVSASTTSIEVSSSNTASNTGTLTTAYQIKKSTDTDYGSETYTYPTFSNLTPGTSYNVKVTMTNPDNVSDTATITIRTRYATPVVYIENKNKYNNKNGVSAASDSITVYASNSAPNTGTLTWEYRIKLLNGSYDRYQTPATFSDLSSGTTYVVEARAENPDGYSDTATVTIRTKYTQSNFNTDIVTTDIGLEHINFTATVKYDTTDAILSGTWSIGTVLKNQTLSVSSSIGASKTGYVLVANTTYEITVVAKLTSTYDDITCTFSKSFKTDAKSSFDDNLGDFNFCYPTEVASNYKIINPSGNKVRCSLVVKETTILTRDKSSDWDSLVDLQLTDAEWDAIYKKLGYSNSVPYTFTIGTYSNKNKNYTTYITNSTGTITLTGKMKTAHVGLEDGSVKRVQARVGVDNKVKLAVVWVGDNSGIPKRVI